MALYKLASVTNLTIRLFLKAQLNDFWQFFRKKVSTKVQLNNYSAFVGMYACRLRRRNRVVRWHRTVSVANSSSRLSVEHAARECSKWYVARSTF